MNKEGKQVDVESHLRQMQLNSLLEMTAAINANLPETSLYKIYHFTLLAGLEIKKLALFVYNQENHGLNYFSRFPRRSKFRLS